MVKYSKEFKEQALLLSDELGVKKAAEQLGINYHTIADGRIGFEIYCHTSFPKGKLEAAEDKQKSVKPVWLLTSIS